MNKTQLVESLSEETTFSKKDIARILDSFSRIVARELNKGKKVQWSGFGTFSLSHRSARNGINPQTKEVIQLPESRVAKFKPGKNLRELVKKA